MKKILIIQESMSGGGAEKVLCDLLDNFDYTRYSIDLLLEYQKGTHLQGINKQVKVMSLHTDDIRPFGEKFLFKWKFASDLIHRHQLKKFIKPDQYDVIISFLEGPSAHYHSLLKEYASRNFTWIHTNLEINHWSLKYWENLQKESEFYQSMDRVLCVSQGVKEVADRLFKLKGNSQVLYNLIDRDKICRKAKEENVEKQKFTICNVGRLAEQKRQDRIIEVAKILKDKGRNVEFWILGVGPLESVPKEQARKAGVENMVLFKGFKSNPYPYMQAADIFLLTSDTEGYPTVVCEALCLGKPIVSTSVTGVDELLANGAGVVCDYNVEKIAEKLDELIKSPKMLANYAETSNKRGREFDRNSVMEHIYSII